MISYPYGVEKVVNTLFENGFEAYPVGGCVRDLIMGETPKDWDVTTSASPNDVMKIFDKSYPTGIKYGTVTVIEDNIAIEVTAFRLDGEYKDNRHPSEVVFAKNIENDLSRRDFTINAMALKRDKTIIDIFGGMKDIENKKIRSVGDASVRFKEDALRILRAIRFSSRFNFEIEEKSKKAMKECAHLLQNISAERIKSELDKILLSPYPEKLNIIKEIKADSIILPEINGEINVIKSKSLNVVWATLLSKCDNPLDVMNRLKFDKATKNNVQKLLSKTEEYEMSAEGARKIGKDFASLAMDFFELYPKYAPIKKYYQEAIKNKYAMSIKDLDINGTDLIKHGINDENIGTTLNMLLEYTIKNPLLNKKEELLDYLNSKGI